MSELPAANYGLDNFSTSKQQNLNEGEPLVSTEQWARFKFVEGDIRDPDACQKVCKGVY